MKGVELGKKRSSSDEVFAAGTMPVETMGIKEIYPKVP